MVRLRYRTHVFGSEWAIRFLTVRTSFAACEAPRPADIAAKLWVSSSRAARMQVFGTNQSGSHVDCMIRLFAHRDRSRTSGVIPLGRWVARATVCPLLVINPPTADFKTICLHLNAQTSCSFNSEYSAKAFLVKSTVCRWAATRTSWLSRVTLLSKPMTSSSTEAMITCQRYEPSPGSALDARQDVAVRCAVSRLRMLGNAWAVRSPEAC